MNCFMLKAVSIDDEWVEFTIKDVPTPISEEIFVLLRRPNSPLLKLSSIRRGDVESGWYEGDVIQYGEVKYLICYERGFYAIDSDYIVKMLPELKGATKLGTLDTIDLGIPISFKKTLLFKYKSSVFKINDIVGGTSSGVLINSLAEVVPYEHIQQDCCLSVNKGRAYLGDVLNNNTLVLSGGQLKWKTNLGDLLPIQEVI